MLISTYKSSLDSNLKGGQNVEINLSSFFCKKVNMIKLRKFFKVVTEFKIFFHKFQYLVDAVCKLTANGVHMVSLFKFV